jgi:hypothetical protein
MSLLAGILTLTEPPRWRDEEERDQPPGPSFDPPTSAEPAHTPPVSTSLKSFGQTLTDVVQLPGEGGREGGRWCKCFPKSKRI